MNEQYCVYQLVCTSERYMDSITPEHVRQNPVWGIGNAEVCFQAAGFYSMSKDPVVVLEDAVQHLIERRREFQRDMLELDADIMGDHSAMNHMLAPSTPQEENMYLNQVTMQVQDAARDHIEMVQGIRLVATEMISFKDSQTIDRAQRFLQEPDEYMGRFGVPANQALAFEARRQLDTLKEHVKYRLLGRVEVQDELNKLVYDLEHRFPE